MYSYNCPLFLLPLTSSIDPSPYGPSSGPRSCPVLSVRQAAALSNQQDFRRWKGLPRLPPLAGFPPVQTQELWVRLRSHVWRDPAVVLLGPHCGPLHVGVLVTHACCSSWFAYQIRNSLTVLVSSLTLSQSTNDYQVVLGGVNIDKVELIDQTIPVIQTIVHENYRETPHAVYNDIGIL